MYFAYLVALGVLMPLLVFLIADTLKAYVSYKARNLSALLRDAVRASLEPIVEQTSAPDDARGFASHLLKVVADSDDMRDRGEWVVANQNDVIGDDDLAKIAEFERRIGAEYVDRFERIFPMLTTACLLLHPTLGRMYYRTMQRTAAASAVSHRELHQAEAIMRKVHEDQIDIIVPPTPLLFQSSRKRDERLWECVA